MGQANKQSDTAIHSIPRLLTHISHPINSSIFFLHTSKSSQPYPTKFTPFIIPPTTHLLALSSITGLEVLSAPCLLPLPVHPPFRQANSCGSTSGIGQVPFSVSYLTPRIQSTLSSSSFIHQHHPKHPTKLSLILHHNSSLYSSIISGPEIFLKPQAGPQDLVLSQPMLSFIFFDASNSASFLSTTSHRKTSIILYRRSQILVSPQPCITFINQGSRTTYLEVPTIDNYLFLYAASTL